MRAHGIEEVGRLLQGQSLFIELLCILGDRVNLLWDFEAKFAKDTCIFDECDKLLRVVHFEEAASLVVKLHELARHLEFGAIVRVLHCSIDAIGPLIEEVLLEVAYCTDDVSRGALELLHSTQVSEQTLGHLEVVLDLEHELAGPDDGAHCVGHVATLRRFLLAGYRIQALPSAHVEFVLELSHLIDKELEEGLTILLHLTLDALLAQETLPALELTQLLRGGRFSLREVLLAELVADLALHGLHNGLVLLHGGVPLGRLELVRVERVDLAEWVEGRMHLETISLLLSEEPQQLVMLRPQLEDLADSDDDVLQVGVFEGLAVPLMRFILCAPKLPSQLRRAVLPASANAHAFVELYTHLGERALPDVVLLELLLDARAKSLRRHFEEVLHTRLVVRRVNLAIPPDAVEAVLKAIYQRADLAQVQIVKLCQV